MLKKSLQATISEEEEEEEEQEEYSQFGSRFLIKWLVRNPSNVLWQCLTRQPKDAMLINLTYLLYLDIMKYGSFTVGFMLYYIYTDLLWPKITLFNFLWKLRHCLDQNKNTDGVIFSFESFTIKSVINRFIVFVYYCSVFLLSEPKILTLFWFCFFGQGF